MVSRDAGVILLTVHFVGSLLELYVHAISGLHDMHYSVDSDFETYIIEVPRVALEQGFYFGVRTNGEDLVSDGGDVKVTEPLHTRHGIFIGKTYLNNLFRVHGNKNASVNCGRQYRARLS